MHHNHVRTVQSGLFFFSKNTFLLNLVGSLHFVIWMLACLIIGIPFIHTIGDVTMSNKEYMDHLVSLIKDKVTIPCIVTSDASAISLLSSVSSSLSYCGFQQQYILFTSTIRN